MKPSDVAFIRLPIQQDFTAIPVLYAKYNVFVAKQSQASGIMPRVQRFAN